MVLKKRTRFYKKSKECVECDPETPGLCSQSHNGGGLHGGAPRFDRSSSAAEASAMRVCC